MVSIMDPNPIVVAEALRRLGSDIQSARKRRRLTMVMMAKRIGVSVPTLRRLEAGDPGVSVGNVACALEAIGVLDGLAGCAQASNDQVGMMIEQERLPKRVRQKGVLRHEH